MPLATFFIVGFFPRNHLSWSASKPQLLRSPTFAIRPGPLLWGVAEPVRSRRCVIESHKRDFFVRLALYLEPVDPETDQDEAVGSVVAPATIEIRSGRGGAGVVFSSLFKVLSFTGCPLFTAFPPLRFLVWCEELIYLNNLTDVKDLSSPASWVIS